MQSPVTFIPALFFVNDRLQTNQPPGLVSKTICFTKVSQGHCKTMENNGKHFKPQPAEEKLAVSNGCSDLTYWCAKVLEVVYTFFKLTIGCAAFQVLYLLVF